MLSGNVALRERLKRVEWLRQARNWVDRPLGVPPTAMEKWLYTRFNGTEKQAYELGELSTEDLCLPNFLVIGAQKAGTTWLYHNLRPHPELFLPDIKEIHYFDVNSHWSARRYASLFEPGADRVRGEVTPDYSALPLEQVQSIGKLLPDAKLILLIRNPIARAWSHALMHLVERYGRRYEEIEPEQFYAHFQSRSSLQRGDYLQMLSTWGSVFPSERIFVGFYEQIAQCPEQLLSQIFTHLGVLTPTDWSDYRLREVIYQGKGISMPPEYRAFLNDLYRPRIEALAAHFGERVAAWRV